MKYTRYILWVVAGAPVLLFLAGVILSLPFWLIANGVAWITTGAPLGSLDFEGIVPAHVRQGLFLIWLGFAAAAILATLPLLLEETDEHR